MKDSINYRYAITDLSAQLERKKLKRVASEKLEVLVDESLDIVQTGKMGY